MGAETGQYTGFLYAASKDALAAEDLAAIGFEKHPEAIAFHAQQCAEKVIKNVFVQNGSVPPKTHALDDLLAMALEKGWLVAKPDEIDAASSLSAHAVVSRYTQSPEIDAGEALEAVVDCNLLSGMAERCGYAAISIHLPGRYLHDMEPPKS